MVPLCTRDNHLNQDSTYCRKFWTENHDHLAFGTCFEMFIQLFRCQLITSKNLLVPMGRHGPSNTVLKHWKGKLQSHQQSSRRRTEQVKKQRDVGASTERLRKLVWEQVQKISRWCNHWPPKIFYFNCSYPPWKVAMFLYFRIESVAVQAWTLSWHPAHSFSLSF